MEQKNSINSKKRILDALIFLCGIPLAISFFWYIKTYYWMAIPLTIILVCIIWALCCLIFSFRKMQISEIEDRLQKLILLDEQGKPIKSWDLQGRTALIIGKAGQGQELDVDLSDCEYSSFIDFQHAVLNFCLDQWYVEDLESHNGVKVKKIEDGECYRVLHRPCRISAGDIIYIASTKLLLT